MAEDLPRKPLDQSTIFNNRTDKINNTSDLTKSNPGNSVGDKIKALQDVDASFATRISNNEGAISSLQAQSGNPAGITSATAVEALLFNMLLVQDNGQYRKLSPAETKLFIESIAMPKTYPVTLEKRNVSDVPHVLVGQDSNLRNITVQCYDADIAFTPGTGKKATFDGSTASIKMAAGELKTFTEFGTNPWSFVAKQPEGGTPVILPVPIFITMGRLTATYTERNLTAADRMQYLPDDVDIRWRNAVDAAITMLDNSTNPVSNILNRLTYLRFSGASRANNSVNLANPTGPKKDVYNGTVTTTPYFGERGDGTTGYIGSGMLVADLGHTTDSGMLMVKPADGTLSNGGVIAGNSVNYSIEANRSATATGFKNGGAVDPITASPGDAVGMNRTVSTTYDTYKNGLFISTFTDPGILPSGFLNLLATYSISGGTGFSNVPLDWAVASPGFSSQAALKTIYDACMLVTAANAAIRANP